MFSLSRLTSSSSAPPSRLPVRPSSSSSSSSSSGSSRTDSLSVSGVEVLHPVEVVRGDDLVNVVDRLGFLEQVISRAEFDWADPKVTRIASVYLIEDSITKFLGRYPVLKANARSSFLSVEPYLPTKNVCMSRFATSPSFFDMYSCLFSDVSLPFDSFMMGVLRTLNVAPSQLHPNI